MTSQRLRVVHRLRAVTRLYQNLTANVLLSYLVTDYDESLWGQDYENGFRGTLNFTYAF